MFMLALAAFVPHRERALLMLDRGEDLAMFTDTLAANSFAPPGGWNNGFRSRLAERWGNWLPDGLQRSRQGPRGALPGLNPAPGLPQPAEGISLPVASVAGPGAPLVSGPSNIGPSVGPIISGGGGGGGGGLLPPFSGGGGSSGGGGIIPPAPPPVSMIPEPAIWAMMILGFGFAGYRLRRQRRSALGPVEKLNSRTG